MIALLAVVLDLVLAGGRVVDGTGAPWFRADVGIRGDRIAAVGDLSRAQARRRVELRDRMVAPGFIDLLGQSERYLLADDRVESKIRQGITTEITGEGESIAPTTPRLLLELKPFDDRYGIRPDWRDLAGYFRRFRATINLVLRPGMAADLVVFDPAKVIDRATYAEPSRYPEGIDTVIVNGKVVLDEGKLTAERPGRPLRRGKVPVR